jgi:HK97 family phage portal protein
VAKREFLPALRVLASAVWGSGADESKDLAQRVRASSAGYQTPGQPYVDTWNVRRATKEAYEGNPLVYRAIEVICQQAIAQRIIIRRGDPEEGPLVSPGLDPTRLQYVLNRRTNPWETALIFRHRLIAQFLLSSRGVFVEVIRTRSNKIGMLHLLDPDLCANIPVEERDRATNEVISSDPIGAVQIQVPGGGYDYLPRFNPEADATTQPTSVLWIRSPHPLVLWRGMSPVQAAGLPIDLDRYARIYNRRFLQNDGRPGGLIAVKGVTDKLTMERIQAQFAGGPESAGRTTVINGDQVTYADTSGSPRDMLWGELSNATRKDIAMTFGVPESVLGDASGRTFDNADAEWEIFWTAKMKPLLAALDDQLDVLTGGYDDDLYLRHDLSKVYVLGRHQRAEEDRAVADYNSGLRSIDEVRDVKRLDPVGVSATRVLWLEGGRIPVGRNSADTDAAAALKAAGVEVPDPAASARAGAQLGSQMGARIAANDNDARMLRAQASRLDREPALITKAFPGSEDPEGEQRRARALRTAEWR